MTREEAKEILTHNWTRVDNPNYSESELDEAVDMAIEALDERKVELFDDGTLVVNVKEGAKVGRVLIDGDDYFGGLYYADIGIDKSDEKNTPNISERAKMIHHYIQRAVRKAHYK